MSDHHPEGSTHHESTVAEHTGFFATAMTFVKGHKVAILAICITITVFCTILIILISTHVIHVSRFSTDVATTGVVTGGVVYAIGGSGSTAAAAGVGAAAGTYAADEAAKGNDGPAIALGVLGGVAFVLWIGIMLATGGNKN